MSDTPASTRPGLARRYVELNAQLWDGQLPAPIKVGLYGTSRGVWVSRIARRLLSGVAGRGEAFAATTAAEYAQALTAEPLER